MTTTSRQVSPRRHGVRRLLLAALALTLIATSCSSDSENVEAVGETTTSALAPATTSAATEEATEAPRNDLFENAVLIDPAALPFTDSVDTTGATSDDDDNATGCDGPLDASIWYSITPTSDVRMLLDGFGTDYSWVVTVATGDRESFELVGCRPFTRVIEFEANVTYHLNVDGSGALQQACSGESPQPC